MGIFRAMTSKNKAMLNTYVRAFVTAVMALYVTGNTDPKALLGAGLAAIFPTGADYVNPKNKAFGIGSES